MILKHKLFLSLAISLCATMMSCNNSEKPKEEKKEQTTTEEFKYSADRFADIEVLRYQVPDFEKLTLQQKKLAYYLYEAALAGRDIIYDQKYKHNLKVRKTLEAILNTESIDKNSEDWKKLETYAKRVFFSNGIHHHYSNTKFTPECSQDYFKELLTKVDVANLPLTQGEKLESFTAEILPIIFDKDKDAKSVNLDKGVDNVVKSANNFYENITQAEVEKYYASVMKKDDKTPISYGLNSKMIKTKEGKIQELVWKVGGMYDGPISKIVYWLEKAVTVAENEKQKTALEKLIKYYKSGDLKDWDDYNIAWVADKESVIDVVNGFIEVYGDAIGKRGSYESVVSFKDMEASKRIEAIGNQAQWFEDNSPIMAEHKKKDVKGITAKVITVIVEGGDGAPSTPIGINLPNANWIRQEHGSKSVSLGNIVNAYNSVSAKSPVSAEFAFDKATLDRIKQYGPLAGELHTDMHEVIGHASGKINDGIGTPDQTLKNYANTLEEARADLVALYYILDNKLVEIGVMPSIEVGKAEYDGYINNGLLTQLNRLELGEKLEEAHMRNRQLVAKWAFEKGEKQGAIEKVKKDGKTYFHILDYNKMRTLFGELLKEIQRIKSEGDYKAATDLVENYGVQVDAEIHKEVKDRFKKLNVAPYKGFIQPKLVPVMEGEEIKDVKVEYPDNFLKQMLEFGKNYSFLK